MNEEEERHLLNKEEIPLNIKRLKMVVIPPKKVKMNILTNKKDKIIITNQLVNIMVINILVEKLLLPEEIKINP